MNVLQHLRNDANLKACIECLQDLFILYEEFEMMISDPKRFPMAVFWNSYLSMVQTLRDFVKSIKLGDWDLHIYSSEKMLYWYHAYDHYNYARHFSYYWASQQALSVQHPNLFNSFKEGGFSTRRSEGKFNKVSPDQVIEQTINKDQKGPGGIIGFSTTEGTVQRWVLSSHVVAKVRADMEDTIGLKKAMVKPKELQTSRMKFDEEAVQNCYNTITQWCPIFSSSDAIVSLSSGINAPQNVQKDLLDAELIGKRKFEEFVNNRIKENKVGFYDVIKKNNLKTFSTMKQVKKLTVNGKDIVIQADRSFFARILIIQEKRSISTRELLKHSLGPIAWSLATTDGSIYKSVKSKLLNVLEEKIQTLDTIPQLSARIYDGMCIIQQVPSGLDTFGELSKYVLQRVITNDSPHVFFITDQYWKQSIKSCERNRRNNDGSIRITATRCDQKLPKQMKKYLCVGENKEELVDFLLDDWSSNCIHQDMLRNRCLYFTTKEKGYVISCTNEGTLCRQLEGLSSNQEEADTKVFLAAKFAQDIGCTDVALFTVDSDVAILAGYYSQLLVCRLVVQIGTGVNVRIIDVGNNEWAEDVLNSLPSLHAISGCDSVSAVNGIGKAKWLKTIQKNQEYIIALQKLGENITVDECTVKQLEKLFCHLYGMPDECDINEVRYQKFCKEKVPEPHQLPPTKDELFQHIKRANYQSFVWKRALQADFDVPSPIGNGWSLKNDILDVVWMEKLPAPESVLELVTCDCRRLNCNGNCQCRVLLLECTDICKCHGNCENVTFDQESDNDDDEIDNDDINDF